jgi:hypothetical protein
MTKVLYRAFWGKVHGNGTLPCKKVLCALCRAPRQKMHDRAFAVQFLVFAVRPRRTAKPMFPVVSESCMNNLVQLKRDH